MNDSADAAKPKAVPGSDLFSDLFVLELANNHWGSVERGKEIIRQHGRVVQETGVKAAVKFQFRDVDTFVHDAFKPHEDVKKEGEVVQAPGSSSRYIKKTIATKLTPAESVHMVLDLGDAASLLFYSPEALPNLLSGLIEAVYGFDELVPCPHIDHRLRQQGIEYHLTDGLATQQEGLPCGNVGFQAVGALQPVLELLALLAIALTQCRAVP